MSTRPSRTALVLAILVSSASFLAAPAAASHDRGLFELDGGVADASPGAPYDWASLFSSTGAALVAGGPVLVSAFDSDHALPDVSYHDGSDKDIEDITTWQCSPVNSPQDKTNLLNAYAVLLRAQDTSQHLYFGFERATNNGNSFMGFWFLQNPTSCASSASAAGSFTRGHTPGDILVLSDFTGGGSVSRVSLYVWDPTVGDNLRLVASNTDCGSAGTNDLVCGRVNSGALSTPWLPGSATPLATNTFFEGGLNLTRLMAGGVPCFAQYMAETRTSQELTAQLKDYATSAFKSCDARISVGPLAATNVVGDPHTFTFTVEKRDVGQTWGPAAGETVQARIVSGPGGFVGPSACVTDAAGTCSVTIVSTVGGATTLAGDVAVALRSSVIERSTDGTEGSSAPAVKTWLRAPSQTTVRPTLPSIPLGSVLQGVVQVTGDLQTPTGTVAVHLCAPSQTTDGVCADGGSPVGTLTLAGGATTPDVTPTVTGTWCFRAAYAGDATYLPSSESSVLGCFEVTPATPTLATRSLPQGDGVAPGAAVADRATVAGLGAPFPVPTGEVVFHLCGPAEVTAEGCPTGGAYVGSAPLDATGVAISPTTEATWTLGAYCWRAAYAGDANHLPVTHTNADSECFVVRDVDLVLAKSVDATSAAPGDELTYTLTLAVAGNLDATGVFIADVVPARTTLVSCDGCAHDGTAAGTALRWDLGTIAPPEEVAVTFRVVLDAAFPAGTTLVENVAAAGSTETGEAASDPVVVPVHASADLGLVKSSDVAAATEGDLVTFTLAWFNAGDGHASSATIVDAVPEGASFVSCTGGCSEADGVVEWDVGEVAAHTSADAPAGTVTLTVRIESEHACQVCNAATLASPDQDGETTSNTVCLDIVPDVDRATGAGGAQGIRVAVGGADVLALGRAAASLQGAGEVAEGSSELHVDEAAGDARVAARVVTTTTRVGTSAAGASTLSVAEVVGLDVLGGLVTASKLRSVAEATATSTGAAWSTAGTTVVDLRVAGVPVDLVPGVQVPLAAAGPGSYLVLLDAAGAVSEPAGRSGGDHGARAAATGLRVHLADVDPLLPGPQPLDIVVAAAQAEASFPQDTPCAPDAARSATASAALTRAGDAAVGAVEAPATGGSARRGVGEGLADAQTGLSAATVELSGAASRGHAVAQVERLCLLAEEGGCAVSADLVRAEALATADPSGAATSAAGSRVAGLVVGGQAIEPVEGQVVEVPGVGFLVVGEELPLGGGLLVRGLRLVVTEGPLAGSQLAVAEASASAAWG